MRRHAFLCLGLSAISVGLLACEEEAPVSPPPAVPLSQLIPAAQKEKPKAPPISLPPRVAAALQGIQWETLDYLEYLPTLAYKVPSDCKLHYVDLGSLSLSDSSFGTVRQSFYQAFTLEAQGAERMLRRPGKRLEHAQIEARGRKVGGFVDTSKLADTPVAFQVKPQEVAFPSVLSPVFGLRTGGMVGSASPAHIWPTLPVEGKPAAWKYNLLFGTPDDLATQPPAKVEFVGWLRLGFQRAAYVTATWAEDQGAIPIGAELAHMRIQGKRPLSSTLQQLGVVTGHYLISENGYPILAHVEGTARIRNVFHVKKRKKASGTTKAFEHPVFEDRNFAFTTKLLADCNGSLFSKVESEELSDAEVVELADRCSSVMAIDRKTEAAALLSPAIRYEFPEGVPLLLIKEMLSTLGTSSFGKPGPGSEEPGVSFVGTSKRSKKSFYSTVRGARMDGTPYITFIGSSSRPDKKTWDMLVVAPGNVHSGVVKLFRP